MSWKVNGNITEDFLNGGLRQAVVNDVRNCSLESCLPPPTVGAKDRWVYATQGTGSGIICDISFQNPLVFEREQQNVVTQGLLQHGGPDATWGTLWSEVAGNAFEVILSCSGTASSAMCSSSSSSSPSSYYPSIPIIEVRHEPLFFYGRYRKFSRTMSQSPWFANGVGQRVSKELSLQEEIANRLLPAFFPHVQNIEELNCEYAKTDSRLYSGRRNALKNNSVLGSSSAGLVVAGDHDGDINSFHNKKDRGGFVSQAKQEICEARGSLNATAVAGAAPARRQREEGDGSNDNEQPDEQDKNGNQVSQDQEGENDNDQSPAGRLGVVPYMRCIFNNVYGFSLYRFHAGGREDVDVRMLGNGRPFVLEITNPHKQLFTPHELQELADSVCNTSDAVEIDSLAVASRSVMLQLQQDAEGKKKAYRCICYTQRPIRSASEQRKYQESIRAQLPLVLSQRTPTRVLHRRANLVRKRSIYKVDIEFLNQHWMIVDLLTQAGTYVKEFCHGDMGRTLPNLSTLLESPFTDIVQLDVKELIHSTSQKFTKDGEGMIVEDVEAISNNGDEDDSDEDVGDD